jgi:DNA-binding transcriptional ArsR family regulator
MYQKEEYDRNRRKIILALFSQSMDFTALRDETKLSEPSLSRHLRDLLNSGFIELKKDGRRRIYKLTEKAFEMDCLLMHLIGIHSALKTLLHRKIWQHVGEEAVRLFALSDYATITFISIISRFLPRDSLERRSGRAIFDDVIAKMTSDFSSLKKMIDVIESIELRGGDAEVVRKKFQEKFDRLTSIYLALGPPFSYMWKDMSEALEK